MKNISAFPRAAYDSDVSEHHNTAQEGMTLRDYFAAKALQGVLAKDHAEEWNLTTPNIAKMCYAIADAMLETRESL